MRTDPLRASPKNADPYATFLASLQRYLDDKTIESILAPFKDESILTRSALVRGLTLAQIRSDPETIRASILLDLSDSVYRDRFPECASLIDSVRRLRTIRWTDLNQESTENLRRMFVAMATDIRVILITLADRIEQMQRIDQHDTSTQQLLANETLEVFSPLANRLGIWQFKWPLEDLALRTLQPQIYQQLRHLLAETRIQRDQYVNGVIQSLESALHSSGISGQISGRPKHIFSIYNKMRRKQVGFDQIYDISAVRIIVKDLTQCYATLGVVHSLWTPIAGEFDDYIARPKGNMYQSLHTAVHGPEGKALEVQIRSEEMHRFAEYGVAAHWAYKEGGRQKQSDRLANAQFDILRQLNEWHSQVEDHDFSSDSLKAELFQDQVYVFSPKGEVMALPKGATALDFAYRIHTMVGHRCKGARINDKLVPLHTPMQTGDRIEILTRKLPNPSRDWLNPHAGFISTSGARQKIRQWFRQQDRQTAISQGKSLLERSCEKLGIESSSMSDAAVHFNFKSPDDLYAALGFGDFSPNRVSAFLLDSVAPEIKNAIPPASRRAPTISSDKHPRKAMGVRVGDTDNILSQPARCCQPVPGDDVIGFISRGRGILIHQRDCPNMIHHAEPERLFELDWGKDQNQRYPVKLKIEVRDRGGLLHRLTEVAATLGVTVRQIKMTPVDEILAKVDMEIEVKSNEQLLLVIARFERLTEINGVMRQR